MMVWRRRKVVPCLLWSMAIALAVLLGLGMLHPPSAAAVIRELEEAPEQMLYQSRQTLKDQHGNSWQAIAFKRIRSNGQTSFDLRLVGFPGVIEIDHSQPLTLINSLGKTVFAEADLNNLFTNPAQPEPNVGQYDLQPLLSELQAELPLKLKLPTTGSETVSLSVSPSLVEEWHIVVNS